MSLKTSQLKLLFIQKLTDVNNRIKKQAEKKETRSTLNCSKQYRDNKSCILCKTLFDEVSILEDNKVTSDINNDKKDNGQAHAIKISQLMCIKYNVIRKQKKSHGKLKRI